MGKKGKGKNLSSLGDLLMNIAALSSVKPQKAEGVSASATLPEVFSGGVVKVDNSITKINGLVNEFITTANSCRQRWPMGLGKYLLLKLEGSMSAKGVLQVDKVEGHSGNWVFVTATPWVSPTSSTTSRVLPCAWATTRPPSPSSPPPSPARSRSPLLLSTPSPLSGLATKRWV